MKVNRVKLSWMVFCTVLLLGAVTVLSTNERGETLTIIKGDIQGCEYLGGGDEPIPHATIKTENDTYVTAIFPSCRIGMKVNVLVTRGMLYFNTVYVAEKA